MTQFNNNFYKNLFHKVHNILRDGETALTGMAALNEINNFILFIFIEPRVDTLFQGVDNTDKLKFSYLVKEYIKIYGKKKNVEFEILAQLQKDFEDIMRAYLKQDKIKKYIKTEVNKSSCFVAIKPRTNDEEEQEKYQGLCRQLFELIKELSECLFNNIKLNNQNINKVFDSINFDMLGDAYEQFKEDEVGNQGKRMGQYFTPRSIIRYCIEKQIRPKGTETVYDSSCGTGGFIHYLNKYVCEEDKENKEGFKSNIYGNDKTADVMKPLFINLLLHDIGIDNIKNRNSLGKTNCKECFEKFDVCVGNPPYGLKNKVKYDDFSNIISNEENEPTGINYWPSLLKTGKNDLIKDSMGQFLVHVINSLKVGGRFSLVIDRGILNNGTEGNAWQKRLRQWLLTCCELNELILLPKGIFTHTMFDTAIIYGTKCKSLEEMQTSMCEVSTTVVNVFVADFEDKDHKIGLYVPPEPTDVWDISEIIGKGWSLKYDDYVQTEEVGQEGIEYEYILNLCKFKKSKRKASDADINGNYYFYTSSNKIKKSNYNDFQGEHILIGDGGKANCHYVNKNFSCTSHNYILYNFDINPKYLYYYIKVSINVLEKLFTGNGLKNLKLNQFKKFKIPILSPEHQERIVNFMDDFVGEDYGKLDQLVSEFKDIDLFEFLLREDYDTMGLALEYITKKNMFQTENKKFNDQRKRCCFKTVSSEMKTLGEVCEIQGGVKFKLTKQPTKTGNFIYLRGGDVDDYYTDKFKGLYLDYKDERFKNFSINKGDIYYTLVGTVGVCGEYKINQKSIISGNLARIYNSTVNNNFLVNYLVLNKPKYNCNAQPNISKNTLAKIKIPVPSLADQQKVVDMIEAIDAEDSQYNQMLDGIKSMIETVYQSVTNITT